MVPTENFGMFQLAQDLGKTVAELLTGQPRPLSAMERYLWSRWKLARARLEQQQRRPGNKFT